MSVRIMSGSNAVYPAATAPLIKQKTSPNDKSRDDLSTADLIEAMTVRLKRLDQLEQENKNLKHQLQSYEMRYCK